MIEVRTYPDKGPIGDRGCAYIAECEVDGARHIARSHFGASFALARILVAAGVSDQPMRVRQDGLAGFMTWLSMHKAAGFAMTEGRFGLHRVKWVDQSLRFADSRDTRAGKRGG